MVNASSCTVELWMDLGDVLGGLLNKNLSYSVLTSSAQWEYEACTIKVWF